MRFALALLAAAARAVPGERDQLNACKVMIDRAGPSPETNAAPENGGLQKCRQIIREWILRNSRMSVDENAQPMQ